MKTNVCGIISLTFGIIALIVSCTGLSYIIGIPGMILGIIGMCLPGYKKGLAIAGFICNISAITITTMLYLIIYIIDPSRLTNM